MVSQFALDAIEDLQKDGLSPTPADIIRLNALALKCENGPRAANYIRLPRTAYLGHLVLREPTLGHGEWLDRFLRVVDSSDITTFLVSAAFALSRALDDLPDADDDRACIKAVKAFVKKDLRNLTVSQIRSAVDYALVGNNQTAREYPADRGDELPRDDEAVYTGRLYGAVSVGLGLSVADIRRMRPSEVDLVSELALERNGINLAKSAKTNRLGEFYDTVEEIKARLKKEKEESTHG